MTSFTWDGEGEIERTEGGLDGMLQLDGGYGSFLTVGALGSGSLETDRRLRCSSILVLTVVIVVVESQRNAAYVR